MSSNHTGPVAAMFGRIMGHAASFARGKDGLADVFADLFDTTAIDTSVTTDTPRAVYVAFREEAERVAVEAHNPLKAQDDKSRNAQVSKLANAVILGVLARSHDSVAVAMREAFRRSAMKYTPLVKCATAMKAVCQKAAKAGDAPALEDLRQAIADALADAPLKPASEKVAAMGKAWAALTTGTDEAPSPYADRFALLQERFPAHDIVGRIARLLDDGERLLERLENEGAELPPVR